MDWWQGMSWTHSQGHGALLTDTLSVACSALGAPGGPLWGAWWQRGPSRAAGAFERLDAVLETYTDVTRFPRCGPDRRVLRQRASSACGVVSAARSLHICTNISSGCCLVYLFVSVYSMQDVHVVDAEQRRED